MDSKQRIHVLTLANSIIGVSILAMPFCFKQCGIILSIVLLLLSSILCRLACHFLLKSAIKARLRTFEFLAYYVFGSIGKLFVEIAMIGFLLGTCVAFFVVMGDLGPQIIAQVTETKSMETLRTTILVVIGLFCVLPLGLLRNVDSLSSVSMATIIFYATLVLKIFVESAPHLFAPNWFSHIDLWKPYGVLQCIPIFSMALFCQTQLFEIYQAIPNASLEKMNEVVKIAVSICTSVYIFVGVFGYIAISQKPIFSGNILMDFEPSLVTETMKLGFVLSVAFSFPLIIFPCRASLYSLLCRPTYTGLHDATNLYIPEGKFRILTLGIVIVSMICGILIPNIELVLGLLGSTIGIMICVIFPATCFICLTDKNTNERILAQIMLIIGIAVMVLGTYANLYAIDHVELKQNTLENIKSSGSNVDIHIKDVPLNDNAQDRIMSNGEEIKEASKIDKEMQIKIPDPVKESRHEPVQPEEPAEPIDVIVKKESKAETNNEKPKVGVNDDMPSKRKDDRLHDTFAESAIIKKEASVKVADLKDSIDNSSKAKIKSERKEQVQQEVDIEAIKKEDQELAKGENAKETLVLHKQLVEEEKKLVEKNIQILEEIKLLQAQNVEEKRKAMKNIESIAQSAIVAIQKSNTNVNQAVIDAVKVDAIKQIVKQLDDKADKVVTPNVDDINSIPNAAPLSYQLGLQNKTYKVEKIDASVFGERKPSEDKSVEIDVPTIEKDIGVKRDSSVLDNIGTQLNNNSESKNKEQVKGAPNFVIPKKNFTTHLLHSVIDEQDKKEVVVEETMVLQKNKKETDRKEEQHKKEENLRRDILSKDYHDIHTKSEV